MRLELTRQWEISRQKRLRNEMIHQVWHGLPVVQKGEQESVREMADEGHLGDTIPRDPLSDGAKISIDGRDFGKIFSRSAS